MKNLRRINVRHPLYNDFYVEVREKEDKTFEFILCREGHEFKNFMFELNGEYVHERAFEHIINMSANDQICKYIEMVEGAEEMKKAS
jgi:hypothetical protein